MTERSSWPGNWIMPDANTRCQIEVTRWPQSTDVTTVLVTRLWHGPNDPPGGMSERLRLLRTYTVPSILGQTRHPDAWLLLIGEHWLPDMDNITLLPWAHLVVMRDDEALTTAIRRGITNAQLPHRDRIVVTRCDGDDALATDYFQALLAYISAAGIRTPMLLEFPIGMQLGGDHTPRLDVRTAGHFHAVVQPTLWPVIGPFTDAHTEVWRANARLPAAAMITRWPMWCEVVHDGNAANRIRHGPVLAPGWADRFHLTALEELQPS